MDNSSHLAVITQFCIDNGYPLLFTESTILITAAGLAALVKAKERTVTGWLKKHQVRIYKPGDEYFFSPTDLLSSCPVIHGEVETNEKKTRKRRR